MFVKHPLVRENAIESRVYQEVIVANASKKNTLVVAPTALGKTIIAVLLAAHRLERHEGSKVLMLSSTRPLVNQHRKSFETFLKLDKGEMAVFTGSIPPAECAEVWAKSRVTCATPQVVENDLISGAYRLDDVSLLIIDEAHRAVGDYPYSFIARRYLEQGRNSLVLGLTASPGGNEAKIKEVCEGLGIENIEVRTEGDPDVSPYLSGFEVLWKRVDLPKEFGEIKVQLEKVMKARLSELKKMGFSGTSSVNISRKDLLLLRGRLQEELAKNRKDPVLYQAISLVAACINLSHAIELLETQGLETLKSYFNRIERQARGSGSKAVKGLFADPDFKKAVELTGTISEKVNHPKLEALAEIVQKELDEKQAMVFTQYRDSAKRIVERLSEVEGARPIRFVGQAAREGDKGLSQKEQLSILERFKKGEHNVLVATSVAEEGLDIPNVDLVVFYEPIPSEIRAIQRRGRTGRRRLGKVVVLITRKTRDEGFYWSSFHKERRMRNILESMKSGHRPRIEAEEVKQKKLQEFFSEEHAIFVDSSELASNVARKLLEFGILSKPKKLEAGDYILSDRVAIERKTAGDFLQSIIDGRLLDQLIRMRQTFARPILLIEGEGLYSKRNIHPNAIRGALASIAIDLGIPTLFTKDEGETAAMIAAIVKRERDEKGREVKLRGEKRIGDLKSQQEYVVAGLPNINTTLAKRLLKNFETVERVFAAKEEDLEKVQGIGKKTAEELRRVITSKYD